jgi:hypothetical protein
MKTLNTCVEDVVTQVLEATKNWPPFNSAHEGYAVLLEEVDELWDEVRLKQKDRQVSKMYKEASQVAAMAIRLMYEVCNEETIRK